MFNIEKERAMVFRPQGSSEIVVTSPEELASNGIHIYPNVIEQTWGPDAIERYTRALASNKNTRGGQPVKPPVVTEYQDG